MTFTTQSVRRPPYVERAFYSRKIWKCIDVRFVANVETKLNQLRIETQIKLIRHRDEHFIRGKLSHWPKKRTFFRPHVRKWRLADYPFQAGNNISLTWNQRMCAKVTSINSLSLFCFRLFYLLPGLSTQLKCYYRLPGFIERQSRNSTTILEVSTAHFFGV